MKARKPTFLFFLTLCLAGPARGQFIAVGGGGQFFQGRSAPAPAGAVGGPASADFTKSGLVAVDAGMPVFPFVTGGLHFSSSDTELSLRRGDAFGSSAAADVSARTLTFDARVRTPEAFGLGAYGLAGAGFTRFGLKVKQQVEVPFPSAGAPGAVTSPVFTFGGGVERRLLPYLRLKLEVRDYVTGIPKTFFQPGGTWHRVAVIGGLVLGR